MSKDGKMVLTFGPLLFLIEIGAIDLGKEEQYGNSDEELMKRPRNASFQVHIFILGLHYNSFG